MKRAQILAANPAAVAMMVGAAKHKSETAAKTAGEEGQQRQDQAKVSLDLGSGTISTKDMPVEDFHAEMAKAYEGPQRELSATLQRMSAKLNRDTITKELSTYQGRVAAARELGANPLTARIDAWRIGSGRITPDRAVDQVAMKRAGDMAGFYKATSPMLDDARAVANMGRAEDTAAAASARRSRQDVVQAINRSDSSNLTEENVAAEAGLDPSELTPKEKISIKARRDSLTMKETRDRRARVAKAINDVDLDALDPDTVAKLAGTDQLDESEIASLNAKKKKLQDKEQRDIVRENRLATAQALKQAAATRADEARGRVVTNKEKADRRRDVDAVGRQIEKNNDKITANQRAFSKLLPGADADQRKTLQEQNFGLVAENRKLMGDLASLRGGQSAPKVGDRKDFPNGKTGQWDGKGWAEVKE